MATPTQPDLDKNFTKGRFKDRVFIVTGGTSGIGFATAERLCNDGAIVALFARNQDHGKGAESKLEAKGYRVRFFSVDVSKEEDCERGVQEVVREFGEVIHGLVNNAGIVLLHEKGEDVTAVDFEKVLGVNLKGPLYMVKSCLPYLKKGKDCAIVNISSLAAETAYPCTWEYNASKGALNSLTRSMALDLNTYGIRVNGVGSGSVWTDMTASAFGGERSEWEPKAGQICMMKRFGEPSELAAAIAFLLSKDAAFITGAILDVDGGSQAMCPPVGR